MRQVLKVKIALVLGVLGGIFVSVMAAPTKTVTETDLMAIHGLRVRVPNHGLQVRIPNEHEDLSGGANSTALIVPRNSVRHDCDMNAKQFEPMALEKLPR